MTGRRVLALLKRVLRAPAVDETAAFGVTFEWDSLKHIEVIMEIEREFGIKVGSANVTRLTSVPAITAFLAQQGVVDVSG